jgi:hypothetical protein
VEPATIHQLARGAVRSAFIPTHVSPKPHDLAHKASEVVNGDLVTGTDVNVAIGRVVSKQKYARVGKIIDVKELSLKRTAASYRQRLCAVQLRLGDLRIRAGRTWLVVRSKLSPARRGSWASLR